MSATGLVLPVLDLSQFHAGPDGRSALLRKVRDAAGGPGFFYLIGPGIGEDLTRVLALSRRFFALPEPDKLEIEMTNSPHFRGYNRAGFEHAPGKPDWREQIDIGAEREALPLDPAKPAPTLCFVRSARATSRAVCALILMSLGVITPNCWISQQHLPNQPAPIERK